ncbi:hypothetical protein N8927_04590 [Crocinitomicaceae bacterium]|nr:hypothetical protein [Crocinitomicaceae bacterium]
MKKTLLFLSVFLSANLFGQNVYIPDANFKAYLVGNSEINTNGDTEIQVSEATAFDGSINCDFLNISDLTGIESFNALIFLVCSGNQLTSLDVSQNSALLNLECAGNQLTSLDLSQNIDLRGLDCHANQLTSLDVSQNVALEWLECDFNQLTCLDVSQNTALVEFNCESNQLTCLDISNGNNINVFIFYAVDNPNLTCIEVDDAEYSSNNFYWTEGIDSQMYFSEDCNNDCDDDCDDPIVGINELTTTKNLIQILDMMGRETSFKPNTPLIYVYDDGSIEKVFTIE